MIRPNFAQKWHLEDLKKEFKYHHHRHYHNFIWVTDSISLHRGRRLISNHQRNRIIFIRKKGGRFTNDIKNKSNLYSSVEKISYCYITKVTYFYIYFIFRRAVEKFGQTNFYAESPLIVRSIDYGNRVEKLSIVAMLTVCDRLNYARFCQTARLRNKLINSENE